MDIYVYSDDLTLLGVVDITKSVIWQRKFHDAGIFEIYAPATMSSVALLQKCRYVVRDGDDEVGMIDYVHVKSDEEGAYMITASGVLSQGILNRVILSGDGTLSGLISANCINDSDRAVPKLAIGNVPNITYENNATGYSILKMLTALSHAHGIGYKVTLNEADRLLVFTVYEGVDRSESQSVNPRMVFSSEYDNLITSEYTASDVGAINTVYGRCAIPVGTVYDIAPEVYINGGSGAERREAYITVDAVTYDVPITVNGTVVNVPHLNYTQSLANLQAECDKAIVASAESFEGGVLMTSGYKTSYDLGDIVTVFDDVLGLSITQRITEVAEVDDNENNAINPVFGSPARTILDILGG